MFTPLAVTVVFRLHFVYVLKTKNQKILTYASNVVLVSMVSRFLISLFSVPLSKNVLSISQRYAFVFVCIAMVAVVVGTAPRTCVHMAIIKNTLRGGTFIFSIISTRPTRRGPFVTRRPPARRTHSAVRTISDHLSLSLYGSLRDPPPPPRTVVRVPPGIKKRCLSAVNERNGHDRFRVLLFYGRSCFWRA